MHPDVQKLLELQKVDLEIARITRDVASLPAERKKRVAALERLEAQAREAEAEFQASEMAARQSEMAIKQADADILKLQERLNSVNNNAEYQATLLQIEGVKRDRNDAENAGLEHLEKIDELRDRAEEARRVVEAEEKVLAEFDAEAEKLRAEREEEVRDVRAKRDELATGIPPELRNDYERLAPARNGEVVVQSDGTMCMGCFTQLTPNHQARLHSDSQIVRCDSCQRVLYLP